MKNFKAEEFHKYFSQVSYRSFNRQNLYKIIEKEKQSWGIKKSASTDKVLTWIISSQLLSTHLYQDLYSTKRYMYAYQINDLYSLVSGIKAGSYLAYSTAMRLHGLSTDKDRTVYLNAERSTYEPRKEDGTLSQDTIDNAFASPQKQSSNVNTYKAREVIITSGKRTDRLGVLSTTDNERLYYFTDLERTLIDCVVRPGYAGGVKAVLKGFKKAKSKLDLQKLQVYLRRLDYTYPYEQSIGFYLDQAGYLIKQSAMFKGNFQFDFYLAHGMEDIEYNKKWKIFYPSEL
jgi:predicted transcriptional regulator of viral defense system